MPASPSQHRAVANQVETAPVGCPSNEPWRTAGRSLPTHSAVLQGVCTLSLGTLVANSELAICSWASVAGGLASATVLGPSAVTRMTSGSGLLNSPPVSLGLDSIHPVAAPTAMVGEAVIAGSHK